MEVWGVVGVLLVLLVSIGLIVSKVYAKKGDKVTYLSPKEFNEFLDLHRGIIIKCLEVRTRSKKEK